MSKFRIPVFWSIGAVVIVEAEDIDAAITKAIDLGPMAATDDCYIDGSFEVDAYQAKDLYSSPIEEKGNPSG
jgi:hypothetical protein